MLGPRPRTQRKPLSARVAAQGMALLFLFGQMAGFYHAAVVQHARCAEHGELVDVEGHGQVATPAAQPARPGHDQLDLDARTGAAHGHEHCTLAPKRRDDNAALTPERAALRLPTQAALATLHEGLPLPRALPLLRLAPKTSPPV